VTNLKWISFKNLSVLVVAGGQDLQEIQRNGETAEGSRRRLSAGGLASGSMEASKHKSSGPDDTTTKEVSFLLFSVSFWTYHLFR
jgi:hypothetical protein